MFITNKTGNIGPSQEEADAFYQNSGIKVKIIGKGIQKWIVHSTSSYIIEAAGSEGSSTNFLYTPGKGALYKAKFSLKKNDVLYILVGQKGTSPSNFWGGSGGGASFVAKRVSSSQYKFDLDNAYVTPLLVAAGGGGTGDADNNISPKNGFPGHCEEREEGGGTAVQPRASGGSGFASNSSNGYGVSFLYGGSSIMNINDAGQHAYGGFGGGGPAYDSGGGGGGYRGGNSNSDYTSADGGYSFNNGIKISCFDGYNAGNGFVSIRNVRDLYCTRTRRTSNTLLLINALIFISR